MAPTACSAVATTVRAGRHKLGLTQSQLAERIGASPAAVAFWETGRSQPGAKFRAPLAAVLGCDERVLNSAARPAPATKTPRAKSISFRSGHTVRAARESKRRMRESARLDAIAAEILTGEHGTGHRAGDRWDLCPACKPAEPPLKRRGRRRR